MNEKRLLLILSSFLFISMFSFAGYAESVVLGNPPSNAILNGTIILNATSDYNCTNATFYYSNNASEPWQNPIGTNNTSSDNQNFTFTFDTSSIADGVYNFTVNVTNSTLENFSTSTNVTIENTPNWYNNTASVANLSEYSPGQNYQFNITWVDDDGLSDVILEFDGVNYTNSSGNLSQDVNVYYRNFTDLPVGNYTYRWIANDTFGNTNHTEDVYSIAKNSSAYINLTLNGTETNRNYNLNSMANFTATFSLPNSTIYLDSNCSSWANLTGNSSIPLNISNITNLTCQGVFFVKAYWNDDTQNYSVSTKTFYFDTIPPTYSLTTTGGITNSSEYDLNKTYWFNITVFAANISEVTLEFNNTTQTIDNSSNNFWWSINDLSAGNYTYRWNITNSLGNENTTGNITLNVTKKPSYAIMYPNPGWTVLSGVTTTVYCNKTVGSPSSTVSLYRDGVLRGTPGANSTYETATLDEDTYNYLCYVTESISSNYTNYSTPGTLTIQSSGTFTPGGGANDDTTDTTTPTGSFTLSTSDSSLTMDAGSSRVLSFTISNTLSSGDVTDVTVTVTGISSDWYALDKTTVDRVRHGSSEKVRMTLNIPSNASADTYTITFKIAGLSFSGSTLAREATVQLTVNASEQVIEEAALTIEQNLTDNGTASNATGFLNISSEYVPYMVLALAAVFSIIIFFNREVITQNLMKIGGVAPAIESKKPKKSIKLPSLNKFNYKLSINLLKEKMGNEPKTLDLKEEKVHDLEREIKKDVKELENIIEAEKKIKKNRK
jgi:hypothetical protein